MLTYAVKMILELLFVSYFYTERSSVEQAMDGCSATDVSRHEAWGFNADERAHGPRYLLVVTVTAVRSINILHHNMADSACVMGAGESREDMRNLHAGLDVGV